MARLGVGRPAANNSTCTNPTSDLDERALAIGVRVLVNIIEQSVAFE